jgi:hypothetical protein
MQEEKRIVYGKSLYWERDAFQFIFHYKFIHFIDFESYNNFSKTFCKKGKAIPVTGREGP